MSKKVVSSTFEKTTDELEAVWYGGFLRAVHITNGIMLNVCELSTHESHEKAR